MAEISALHTHFGLSIKRLYDQYLTELDHYDSLSEKFREMAPKEEIDWDLVTSLNDVHANVTSLKYSLAVLIATFIEGVVNLYLSEKLSPEQFEAIESCKLLDKWTSIINMIEPSYALPKCERTYNLLAILISTRNSLVHMKPRIKDEKGIIQRGNNPTHLKNDHSERKLISEWVELPGKLMENLAQKDQSFAVKVTKFFSTPRIELIGNPPQVVIPNIQSDQTSD